MHMSSYRPHINIPVVVHFKQNASKTECMFKLSQTQSPNKPTFVSQHLPIICTILLSLTLLFMHQRSSFSLSSTVGRIFFLIIFPSSPNLNMHNHKQCVKSPSLWYMNKAGCALLILNGQSHSAELLQGGHVHPCQWFVETKMS